MKSICLSIFLFLAVICTSNAQLCLFEFSGSASCPTQGNQPSITPPSTVTISAVTRYGPDLQCFSQSANDVFATTGFYNEAATSNNYIEISLQAAPGYYLNVSSMYFYAARSGVNPPMQCRVSHDGNGSFSNSMDVQLATSAVSPNIWNSFLPFSSTAGGTVRFRFTAWNNALSSVSTTGVLRLDNIGIYATVTTIPMSGLWVSSTTNNIINTNSGTVGIGTANPDINAKLDVNGNIFTSGKVLIGTTNLAAVDNNVLAVNGNAIFEKVKVRSYAIWPDYVFEDEYHLPSLDEVEAYLRKHKHLPNMISAEEAKDKGLDLADNQAALLRKIEELTLYLIQLNKRMDDLSKENKVLSEQIKDIKNQ